MPNGFHKEPPKGLGRSTIDIVRVAPGKGLSFVAVSDEHEGVVTHWIGGKSVRCSEEECICQTSPIEGRWRGYIAGVRHGASKLYLFEFTTSCAPDFKDFLRIHHTLRGTTVSLKRTSSKRNAKMRCAFSDAQVREADLPDPPDLVDLLARIYQTRIPEKTTDSQAPTVRLKKA